MTRNELQGTAAHLLAKEKRLMCQWATGCGKSGVVLRFLEDNPGMDCLILVPEQNNIENWKKEFEKFNVPLDKVEIACYASFHKYKDTKWDLLVFDEAPHIDTDKRRAICETVSGEYILALGAVIDEDEMKALEDAYGIFHKTYVSLQQAIKWNILPTPEIHICHMRLDNSKYVHFYNGRRLTAAQYYDKLEQKVSNAVNAYNAKPNQFTQSLMYQAGIARKRFLGQMKEEAMKILCDSLDLQKKRYLCFCASIKQAEALGKDHAFTSKTPVSMKLLEKFNSHEIDSLYVVGKLIEGQNLNDIECGVIGQLGGTTRITVQELGRILRAENPIVYAPVFDGTKDDKFLQTLTLNIPIQFIKHYHFNV